MVRPVPAVDGFGASAGQVSWIIHVAGKTFIHCGDTLWHGEWWSYSKAYGPFDAAYMPINGVHIPGFRPQSLMPATMTPEQAVAACVVMGAKLISPIHFGHHDPDGYQEYPDAVPTLLATAKERGLPVEYLEVGEEATLAANR
jgi:L-ascorbate metabolism protein UlaG (beta-lactamase superfamily)